MEKKIIAIALVLVTMVTIFVGCGKKYETTKINGKEYLLVTDDEGNTVVDDENNLVAVVTDNNGEVITYEDGENQTYFVQVYGNQLDKDVSYNKYGSFQMLSGWESDDDGILYKKGTDGNCYIKVMVTGETSEEKTFDSYIEAIEEQNEEIIEGMNSQGYNAEMTSGKALITMKKISTVKHVFKVMDKDGNLIHYAENFYFVQDGTIYKIEYACKEGVGYDEEFICQSYLDQSFKFTVEPKQN